MERHRANGMSRRTLTNRGEDVTLPVVGDAELHEGPVWVALVDPMVPGLGEVLWIVDLNRQSLDRVVPGIAANRIRDMFSAAGWNTITLKYGSRLRELFASQGGELLERRIDAMSNEEYQHLLRLPPASSAKQWQVPAQNTKVLLGFSLTSMTRRLRGQYETSGAMTSAT